MRLLIVMLTALYASSLHANSQELVLGVVSVHTYNPGNVGRNYANKLDQNGFAVVNPVLAWRVLTPRPKDYYYTGVFGGLNSVGRPMGGFAAGAGVVFGTLRLGAIVGAYMQSNRQFRSRGIEPISIFATNNGQGVVPITGVEISKKISKNLFTNIILSPIIVNIGLGTSF